MRKKKPIKEKIMGLNLTKKLTLLIYTAAVSLFIVLSIILLYFAERSSLSQTIADMNRDLAEATAIINSKQLYMQGVADYYATSPDILEMMENNSVHIMPDQQPPEIPVGTEDIHILSIVYYNSNGDVISYNSIDESRFAVSLQGTDIFVNLRYGLKNNIWKFVDQDSGDFMIFDNSPKLCLWRAVRNISGSSLLGVIAVTIDTRNLLGFDLGVTQTYRDHMVILDSLGQVVYNRSGFTLADADIQKLLEINQDNAVVKHAVTDLSFGKYRVCTINQSETNFLLFYLDAYTPFTWNLFPFYTYTFIGILLYILLFLPFLYFISRMIVRPLNILIRSLRQFSSGDYSAHVNFKYNDEIGELGAVFNEMVKENQSLIETKYKLILRNKDAELALLQMQINPHFLYNMLNTIQWMALKKGSEDIADIAYSMAKMFRISLSRGEGIIQVQQEQELILNYLKLQKIRFGAQFEYESDFDERTLPFRIPKLILQPLVENAIIHASHKLDHTLLIQIRSQLDEENQQLHFIVQGNGTGMSQETLANIFQGMEKPDSTGGPGSHFAIKNINERLRILYGEHYTFHITSQEGAGTTIHIVLPMQIPYSPQTHEEVE